jgi:hypothetical protein
MIRIACTNCKTVLSIDDAFAGGVCRCQHCGTIQTVPAKRAGGVGQAVGGSKSIYQGTKSDGHGTGLEELAEIVASSGLSGSGLTSRRLTKPTPAPPLPEPKNQVPIYIAAGGIILLLVIIILWLALRGGTPTSAPNPVVVNPNLTPQPQLNTSQPNICGISLDSPSVIYLLDRGSATQEYFAALKDATLKSATSLGSNRKFQIIFWSNSSENADPVSYPQDSTAYATTDNIAAAQRAIEDVFASGASDVKPALQKALLRQPDAIVIASAKGYSLDDNWVQSIMNLRGSSPVKIDILNLGSDSSAVLKSLAEKTGGAYLDVDSNTLRTFAGH